MCYWVLGVLGLMLLVAQVVQGRVNFLLGTLFTNSMADLMYGLLLLIFKSRWPFKRRLI